MSKKHSLDDRVKYVSMLLSGYSPTYIHRTYGINRELVQSLFEKYKVHGIEGLRKKSNVRASFQLKEAVVRDIEENHLSLVEVSLKYDVSQTAIYTWRKIVQSKGYAGLNEQRRKGRPPKDMGRPKKKTLEEMTELERLRYENLCLRAENALLKKVKALVEEREARLRETGRKPSKN